MKAPAQDPATSKDDALPLRKLTGAETQHFAEDLVEQLPRMRKFAHALLHDRTAADDVVQEAMLRAWAARDRFTPGTNIGAWLYTILKRVHLTNMRRHRPTSDIDDISETRFATPEEQSVAVLLGEVNAAMEELDHDQREALAMVAVEGQSYEEASLSLGVPIGTIKSRVSRARKVLIDIFGPAAPKPVDEAAQNSATELDDVSRAEARQRWRSAKQLGLSFTIG